MSNSAQPKKRPAFRDDSERASGVPNVVPIRPDDEPDPLEHFFPEEDTDLPSTAERSVTAESESDVHASIEAHAVPEPTAATTATREAGVSLAVPLSKRTLIVSSVVAVAAMISGSVWYVRSQLTTSAPIVAMPRPGRVLLNSRPAGAAVLIDGVAHGLTPVELELSAGTHGVVFRSAAGERAVDLTIENGARVVEDIDMPAAAPATAQIDITSDPASARVSLDGRAAGETPIRLRDVAPGRHVIGVSQGSAAVNRTVDVAAGATASVFLSLGASPAPAGATFVVESPVELRVLENGQLLGVANAAPIALGAGKHEFDLVNDTLELRLTRSVTIDPGKTTRISVPTPNGSLFVNASPWADVFVDGRSIGVTPLGNVPMPVGSHDVVFRHPQFGEKQRTVVVGARTPVRVAMDMTR